mgnify:CR=1 FL=1
MQAVILVGGEGTRLRPLTVNTPKSMVPILNQPYLEHNLDYLKKHGIKDVILALGYLPHRIKTYFDSVGEQDSHLTYVVESTPLGTAGAVKNVEPHLHGEAFYVFNGDIVTDIDLRDMYTFHKREKASVTIALTAVENPTAFGVVETDNNGRVRRFVEKPGWDEVTTNMINAGVYIVEPEVLKLIPSQTFYMFEQGLFPLLLKQGEKVCGYPSTGYWIDMGTPEKYLKLHHDLLHKMARDGRDGGVVGGIGEGCSIHPSVQITGPVLIGKNCKIGPRVRIIGPVVLGDGCQVDEGSVIEGAVLWEGVHVGAEVNLKDSILAANCRVAGHCWIVGGCVLGDGVEIGEGNRLGQAIRVWQGKKLEPGTLSF